MVTSCCSTPACGSSRGASRASISCPSCRSSARISSRRSSATRRPAVRHRRRPHRIAHPLTRCAPTRPPVVAPKPRNVRIVFDGIRTRLSMVPIGVDVGVEALSPDGKQVVVTSNVAGQTNLFAYSFDEFATDPAVTRQITTTPGNKNSIQFAPDGKSVWFLEQGRIVNVTLENRAVKQVAVRAELDVDFDREKWDVFHQAWEFLNDNFYDPEFHGTDWGAVHAAYAPYIAGSKTPDEMRRVLSLMIGEMNGSHMGISAPPPAGAPTAATGPLGLEFDRGIYE